MADFDPKRPTHIIDGVVDQLVNGAAAGVLAVPGIELNDIIVLVQSQDRTTGAVADLTSDFSIPADDQITSAIDTTGDNLYVRYFDRDWKEDTFFTPG